MTFLLPYIQFESVEFNALLTWWKDKVITQTKGQFTELPLDDVAPLLPYCNQKKVKGALKNLNIIYDNFQFDFGTGGLHGVCHPGIFKADDEYEIKLIDVSSYYPNLASKNGLHPAHIPVDVFVATIDKMYNQRMRARDTGDNQMVAAIKLALNGALYGKSNSPYSFMYDPQFMMSICVNGQLLLAMLAEECVLAGMQLIQINTDGIMVKLKRTDSEKLDAITAWWMGLTNLKLDYDEFDIIVQRDVNSYIAKYTNGEIKYKGVFDYNYTENGDYHKDYSMMVIPKALEAYFVNGVEPEEFVYNHTKLYDFFKRTKYGKNAKLFQRRTAGSQAQDEQLQNVTRYYIAREGSQFIKTMEPLPGNTETREFAVESGYNCVAVNTMTHQSMAMMSHNINYVYYINKVRQVINQIEI